jgi:DNA-binding transcriptional LysR family regulator
MAMTNDLNALQLFVKVVEKGSFTGAARALAMPKSTVSQRVSELEERLGVRLLQRTTRTLSVTDQGRIYYDHGVRILADLEDADRTVTSFQNEPRGLLRITVPASTQLLAPVFATFLLKHRGVQLEVLYTDRPVDLVEERFDIGLRAGPLSDSTLIARSLGTFSFMMVASPQYLKERGRPHSPADLAEHDALVFTVGRSPRVWRLTRGKTNREVIVNPALGANDLDILIEAAVGGLGITMIPGHRCVELIRAKRLERVLPDWEAPAVPMNAIYPSARHLSPKVKAMLDHLQQMDAPWGPAGARGSSRRSERRARSHRGARPPR